MRINNEEHVKDRNEMSVTQVYDYTWPRVKPVVGVFRPPSLAHLASVTCLATKLCVDLMLGNGGAA